MKAILAVLTITTLLAVACGGASSQTAPPADDASPPNATAPAPEASEEARSSLEGAYTKAEMRDFLSAVVPIVQDFITTTYPNAPEPRVQFISTNRYARTGCGASYDTAYEYCPVDGTISIGQESLWQFYRGLGDAAAVAGIAHEWGHHLQNLNDALGTRTQQGLINIENQADCVAGAWFRYASDRGIAEADDDGDIETMMRFIGEREGRNRTHGTIEERAASFEAGYDGKLKACNQLSDRPIV